MKPVSKLSIFAIVLFAAAGVFAVSFGSVFLFRKNAKTHLEQMQYTKILEMEKGLLLHLFPYSAQIRLENRSLQALIPLPHTFPGFSCNEV